MDRLDQTHLESPETDQSIGNTRVRVKPNLYGCLADLMLFRGIWSDGSGGFVVWGLQHIAECGANTISRGAGDLNEFHAGMLSNGDPKTRGRQVKRLGEQAYTGLVCSSIYRRGSHPKSQDAVDFSNNRCAGRLRLQMDTKGGDIAILSNGNHY